MSRRITIETKMDNKDLVEKSLKETEATYIQKGGWFNISAAQGVNFMHRKAGINPTTQEVFFDEDDRRAESYVKDVLFQAYNKNKALETMLVEGHEVVENYTASSGTYIEGFEDIIEEGDIIIRSRASF